MGEFYDPRVAAGLFLGDLAVTKGKDCLEMTMQHFLQQLTAYATQDPAQRDYPTKHGIMLAVGTISPVLKKKKHYHGPLEELLRNHVLPEFQSPVGYLRARACWVYSQFSNIKFRLPDSLLDCVVTCLQDGELPVRVHAALRTQLLESRGIVLGRGGLQPGGPPPPSPESSRCHGGGRTRR